MTTPINGQNYLFAPPEQPSILSQQKKKHAGLLVQIFILQLAIEAWHKFGESLRAQATEALKEHRHKEVFGHTRHGVEEEAQYLRVGLVSQTVDSQAPTSSVQAGLVRPLVI